MLKLLRGAAAAPEPPASVLADWNAYATSGADEESVLAPLSAVTGRIGDAARKVKESAAGAAANVPSGSSAAAAWTTGRANSTLTCALEIMCLTA